MYAETPADPRLRSLVACVWAMTGACPPHRVLPDGCIDIVVFGGREARVVGTMTRAITATSGDAAIVGVRFLPGEAARLLPDAPRELTDGDARLTEVWGDDGSAIEQALLGALAHGGALLDRARRLLDRVLLARLAAHGGASDLRVRAAATLLCEGATVRAAASRACLSERQLVRRFRERVGVGPKTFARVMRLRRATALLDRGLSLLETSQRAGYADQAHFTREARDLAGVTPAVLAAQTDMSDSFKTKDAAAE